MTIITAMNFLYFYRVAGCLECHQNDRSTVRINVSVAFLDIKKIIVNALQGLYLTLYKRFGTPGTLINNSVKHA